MCLTGFVMKLSSERLTERTLPKSALKKRVKYQHMISMGGKEVRVYYFDLDEIIVCDGC